MVQYLKRIVIASRKSFYCYTKNFKSSIIISTIPYQNDGNYNNLNCYLPKTSNGHKKTLIDCTDNSNFPKAHFIILWKSECECLRVVVEFSENSIAKLQYKMKI